MGLWDDDLSITIYDTFAVEMHMTFTFRIGPDQMLICQYISSYLVVIVMFVIF